MIKRNIIISLFLILTFQIGKADNTGKWNSYLSYYQIQNIEKANDILFVQASNALYAFKNCGWFGINFLTAASVDSFSFS